MGTGVGGGEVSRLAFKFVAALGGTKVIGLAIREFLESGGGGNEGSAHRILLEFAT